MFDWLYSFDLAIAKVVDAIRSSCGAFLTPILKIITYSGNLGLAFIIAGLLLLLFRRTRRAGLIVLVSLLLGSLFANVIPKNLLARPRPFIDQTSEFYSFYLAAGSLKESGYSFPSSHTTAAAAFGFALFLHEKKNVSWLYLFIPLLMGFTRLYFAVHYASDVIGGIIVGFIAGALSFLLIHLLSRYEKFNILFPPKNENKGDMH